METEIGLKSWKETAYIFHTPYTKYLLVIAIAQDLKLNY